MKTLLFLIALALPIGAEGDIVLEIMTIKSDHIRKIMMKTYLEILDSLRMVQNPDSVFCSEPIGEYK